MTNGIDKSIALRITRDQWLEAVMDSLSSDLPLDALSIPHSSVFYTRAAIEQKTGKHLSVVTVERLLFEEGLMPAEAYGIPPWYADKHLTDHGQNVQGQAGLDRRGKHRRQSEAVQSRESKTTEAAPRAPYDESSLGQSR